MISIKVIIDLTIDSMLTIEHNKIDGCLPMCYNLIFTRKCPPWSNDLNVCFDALSHGFDSLRVTNEIFFFEVTSLGLWCKSIISYQTVFDVPTCENANTSSKSSTHL